VRRKQPDWFRRATADLRDLAATLEKRGIPPLPLGRMRRDGWFARRSGGPAGGVSDRPLRFRPVREQAWLVRCDDTSLTLALDDSGQLWVVSLIETGRESAPHHPSCELEGHGRGVKFLSWPGAPTSLQEAPDGSALVLANDAGWGYLFTAEISLNRLIAQTLNAYTDDPRWASRQIPRHRSR
jgi:hypothetical protein